MLRIDADAHVLETEKTWEYMEGAERKFRPQVVGSTDGLSDDEYWLGRRHLAAQIAQCRQKYADGVAGIARCQRASETHGRAGCRHSSYFSDDLYYSSYASA